MQSNLRVYCLKTKKHVFYKGLWKLVYANFKIKMFTSRSTCILFEKSTIKSPLIVTTNQILFTVQTTSHNSPVDSIATCEQSSSISDSLFEPRAVPCVMYGIKHISPSPCHFAHETPSETYPADKALRQEYLGVHCGRRAAALMRSRGQD